MLTRLGQTGHLEVEFPEKPLRMLVDSILCALHIDAPQWRGGSRRFLLQGPTQFLHFLLFPEPGCSNIGLELFHLLVPTVDASLQKRSHSRHRDRCAELELLQQDSLRHSGSLPPGLPLPALRTPIERRTHCGTCLAFLQTEAMESAMSYQFSWPASLRHFAKQPL